MIPVVTPEEMRAIDAAAPEPVEVLIERAGAATAAAALRLLGRAYGSRVLLIAGKGNNGNDGRSAARRLARRGARVTTIAPGEAMPAGRPAGPPVDLVIDAAYGTGLRGGWEPPEVGDAPVLAVDIPSGVDGMTGEPLGRVLAATATVTFAAAKPGLLLASGRALAGWIELADIGLDCSRARAWLVVPGDVAGWCPPRPFDSHKWRAACWVVAGSPAMPGASHLAVAAAQRSGAGYVRLSSPGLDRSPGAPAEAVYWPLAGEGWAGAVLDGADRFGSLVIGPGLGRGEVGDTEIRRVAAGAAVPIVVDGDGLGALGSRAPEILRNRTQPSVLTPHDGEMARLIGRPPAADRLAEARMLAAACRAVVLLKGPTTVIAGPDGEVALSISGDARLATAGSGDVLAGMIGALLAQGVAPWRAAAAGAELHGLAALAGPARGLVSGDLVAALPTVWADLAGRHDVPYGTVRHQTLELTGGGAVRRVPSARRPPARWPAGVQVRR